MFRTEINALATAIIRTIVPFVVSFFVVTFGVDPDTAEAFWTMALGGAYYSAVRVFAEFFPQAGWLLGVNKAPKYDDAGPT